MSFVNTKIEVVMKLKDYIETKGRIGEEYRLIEDSYENHYKPPRLFNKEDEFIWELMLNELAKTTKPQHVGILNDAYMNLNGCVFVNGTSLGGIDCEGGISKVINNKTAVSLVDLWGGSNYYHWMVTCLAKLSLANVITNINECVFIVNDLNKPFIRESLKLIGINTAQCVEVGVGIKCDKLIITNKIADGYISPLMFLRNRMLKNVNKGNLKRLYVSRKNSRTRRVLNEEEIKPILSKYEFDIVECEKLSVKEQIETFSGANIIVGPHGAGITNVLFAGKDEEYKDIKVMELRNRNYQGVCYYKMCNSLGFDYSTLYGIGNPVKELKDLSTNINGNIKIEVNEFENAVKTIIG